MGARLVRFLVVILTPVSIVNTLAAQPQDPADDPLPKGANVRFCVTRPILRLNPQVALLPPRYTDFLAPTMTGGIRRYDLATGRPLDKKGVVGPGTVVVSADGSRAAVALKGALTIVDVATSKQILAVQPPDGIIIVGVPGVSLSADGKILAYGGRGQFQKAKVVVWDVDKNEPIRIFDPANVFPVHPTLSQDGATLCTHGWPIPAPVIRDGPQKNEPEPEDEPDFRRTAQVWDIPRGKELFRPRVTGMGGRVVSAAFSVEADLLALSAGDGVVDLFDVKNGERLHTLLGQKGQGLKVAISPDSKTVASVSQNYSIQRWTTEGKPLGNIEAPPGILVATLTGLDFTDNERVVSWITAQQFCVSWQAPVSKLLSPTMDHKAAIRSVAFPEGDKAPFTSGIDGYVYRWDAKTGGLTEEVNLKPTYLPGAPLLRPIVNLSANCKFAPWLRPMTEIFDLGTGEDIHVIPPPSTPPAGTNMLTNADGSKIITLARQAETRRNGSCVIWDIETQKRVAEFDIPPVDGPGVPIGVMSPDGSRFILGSPIIGKEGRRCFAVIGYDLKTGKKLGQAEDEGVIGTLSMAAADNKTVIMMSTSGRVWSVDYENGKLEPDIDNIPVLGEAPVWGNIAISPDGKRFAFGVVGEPYTSYGCRVYDLQLRKELHTFIGHAGPVSYTRFHPEGTTVASGAQDTSVLVWDLSKLPLPKE